MDIALIAVALLILVAIESAFLIGMFSNTYFQAAATTVAAASVVGFFVYQILGSEGLLWNFVAMIEFMVVGFVLGLVVRRFGSRSATTCKS